ncbi:MAG TPA: exosortase/archaeosortase family protein [Kiritimatiellia bacterium]|nr:exosortase/archaeosortase family protein [Kiritimatiellia bacterium]
MKTFLPDRWVTILQAGLLGVAAFLIYVMFHWYGNTTEVENFGHSAFRWMVVLWKSARIFGGSTNWLGWFIPFISIGLILMRRREIASLPKSVWWPGLLLVALAVAAHWAGARAQQTRLSLLALILLLWSIPLFLYGWQTAKRLMFPVGLLVFCVPLNFLDAITFPMRILAVQIAHLLLNGLGIEAIRAGSLLVLGGDPPLRLDGSDPASGLGILLSLTALTMIALSFLRIVWWKKGVMLILLPLLMILGNAFRFVVLALAQTALSPESTLSLYKNHSTLLVIGLTATFMVLLHVGLAKIPPGRKPT